MALPKSKSGTTKAGATKPARKPRTTKSQAKLTVEEVEEPVLVEKKFTTAFWIAAGVAAIGIIILLFVIFHKPKPKPATSSDIVGYQKANEALGEVLQIRAVQRSQDSVELIKKSDTIKFYKNETEKYKALAGKNTKFYKDNEEHYRNIPNLVPRINGKDSLRAAAKVIK